MIAMFGVSLRSIKHHEATLAEISAAENSEDQNFLHRQPWKLTGSESKDWRSNTTILGVLTHFLNLLISLSYITV
jgi:hypothetical protein